MARTIAEIENQIIAAKEAAPELSGPNTPSRTAMWQLWAYVTASVIFVLEKMWDLFRAEIDAKVAAAVPGIPSWYRDRVAEFQYGDDLAFINDAPRYAVIDPAKQIIKRVSVTSTDEGEAIIKVAKVENSDIVALSTDELLAVRSYVNRIQFAGTKVRVSSLNTDYLKLEMAVYYNPLFDLNSLKTAVETAVNSYLATIPFDGTLMLSRLADQVQLINGINDVVITSAQARINTGTFAAIARTYPTVAGYIQVDPLAPLADTITYIPN